MIACALGLAINSACHDDTPGSGPTQRKEPAAEAAPSASADVVAAKTKGRSGPPVPTHGWSASKQALHALNRLAFGPRPGDLQAVEKAGVGAWIQAQLAPDHLSDEQVLRRLRALPSLAMSTKELIEAYPRPMGGGGKSTPTPAHPPKTGATDEAPMMTDGGVEAAIEGPAVDVLQELVAAKLFRAVGSERQLQERLVDFWFNHFNVFARKGPDFYLVTPYERDAIRPFVFGKFRQLLGATAHHPAMLYYLDNFVSKRGAINENYGRELLELHTLGVEGGYTQADVTEAARVLTGFSIEQPAKIGTFLYRAKQHDPGPETVLGKRFEGPGEESAEQLLDLLAAHPSTAKLIASRLVEAFVSDTPPPALVARLARVFTETGGDLRATYEALFYSSEFWSDAAYRAKTKTPLELVVSAVRAVGAEVDDPKALANKLTAMGEPLYLCPPPTGYKSRADAWIGTGALIARINFGIAMAGGRVKGVTFDREKLVAGAPPEDEGALADRLAAYVLHETLTPATREVIVANVAKNTKHVAYQEPPPSALPQTLGLLLGSPEFQKR